MKKLVLKRVWRSWALVRPSTALLGAIREDEDGNWWEWVSGGKRVLVRSRYVGGVPF